MAEEEEVAKRLCPRCHGRKNIRVHDPDNGWEVIVCPKCHGTGEVDIDNE